MNWSETTGLAQRALARFDEPSGKAIRKPASIIYGIDDKPSLSATVLLGLQHAAESASKVTLPVAILVAIGASSGEIETLAVVTLLISGVASVLMSSQAERVGFGRLMPAAIGTSFIAPSLLAAQAGGVRLMAGMTLVIGLMIGLLSKVIARWRSLFPPEVVGLIAFMVGASQSSLAAMRFLGVAQSNQAPDPNYVLVAAVTLALLAGLSVWGRGFLRLFSTLIAVTTGYVLSAAIGQIPAERWARVREAPLFALPHISPPGVSLDPGMLLPFVILGLTAALKASGDLTVCEKISDADWKRADMKAGGRAMFTCSMATSLSGCLGGYVVMTSSSNVGMAAATGAVSRRIGYACGAILAGMAFLPKVVELISMVPAPVVGAMFLLVVSYNLIAGMQIITTRMMEARHVWIIGLSLLFGLSTDALPGVYQSMPPMLRPLFGSGLTVATSMVVLLNLCFRIGTSRKGTFQLDPAAGDATEIYQSLASLGARWSARKEVVDKAVAALVEFYESAAMLKLAEGPLTVNASFDEFSLDLAVRYQGRLPPRQGPMDWKADAIDEDEGLWRMSSFLMHRLADRVKMRAEGRACEVELHFEH